MLINVNPIYITLDNWGTVYCINIWSPPFLLTNVLLFIDPVFTGGWTDIWHNPALLAWHSFWREGHTSLVHGTAGSNLGYRTGQTMQAQFMPYWRLAAYPLILLLWHMITADSKSRSRSMDGTVRRDPKELHANLFLVWYLVLFFFSLLF